MPKNHKKTTVFRNSRFFITLLGSFFALGAGDFVFESIDDDSNRVVTGYVTSSPKGVLGEVERDHERC